MFSNDLSPLIEEFVYKPVAFMGGFVSGVLQLNLADDPVKSWLDQEIKSTDSTPPSSGFDGRNNGSGPQSIDID